MIEHYTDMTCREGNRQALITLLKQYKYDKDVFSSEKISTPLLILQGEKDSIIPAHYSNEFAQHSEQSKTIILKNTGHILHEEAPDKTVELIHQFLKEPTNKLT
jgi:pimeloyl-ACP methyl ester carboxylesterase